MIFDKYLAIRLSRHTTDVIHSMRPSQVVDNTDRWACLGPTAFDQVTAAVADEDDNFTDSLFVVQN